MIQLHNLKNGLYSTHELITKIEDYQFSKEYKYYKYPFALLQNNLKNVVFIRRGSESVDIIQIIHLTPVHTFQYVIECYISNSDKELSIYSITSIDMELYEKSKINKKMTISNIDIYLENVNSILDNIEKLIFANNLFECH